MPRLRLSLVTLTLYICLAATLSAQTPSKPAKIPTKKPAPADLERQRQREQAYETVKTVWADAKNIADARQRSDISARAFALVWASEPEFARTELTKNFDKVLDAYPTAVKDPKSDARYDLEAALSKLIRALAQKDLAAAQKLQQRYFAVRRQALADKYNDRRENADNLNLATDLLDVDLAQSVQLASRVFERSVSQESVQYLFDLQRKDPRAANDLYRMALALLRSEEHTSELQSQ